MTEPLDLEAIRRDLAEWEDLDTPCQECALDKHARSLLAEVERLRAEEDDDTNRPFLSMRELADLQRHYNTLLSERGPWPPLEVE